MAPVDPSELLTHATWLRRLGRTLVHEDADDLVQDTWVAALRRPPDGEGSVRPWLRTVLTNVARLRWRGDAHRSAREQVVAAFDDVEAPSSEQLLERHELQQLLARLVGELDEPFRSTVLLRFAEGLTPTQIARRLAIPASTERSRLREALARLRVQLDALHGGDRCVWLAAFAPLVAPRPRAVSPLIPLAAAATAVCALAVVVGLARGGSAPQKTTATPQGTAALAHAPPTVAPPAFTWLAQEGAPRRALTGRVLVDGRPAVGALVRLLADPVPSRDVATDLNGRFDFGEQLPREYVLGAALPGKLAAIRRVDLRDPAAPGDIELVLGDCVASLYGRVIDASGTSIAYAEVVREGVIGVETDAAGNYDVCLLPTAALVAEIRIVVRADGFGTLAIPIAPAGRVHHDFVLAPEAVLAGRVVGFGGAPIASARVALDLTGAEATRPPERGVSIATVTDRDGRFRVTGLATGEYQVTASSSQAVVTPVPVMLGAGESRDIELHASSTGVVRGRVTSQGLPVSGVTIAAGTELAISQSDGSFVLARVPVGDIEFATTPYRRTSGAIHVVEGDGNRADITVEPLGVLRGTVRRLGVPVPFARVSIRGPSRAGLTANVAGYYEARGLDAGTYSFYCDDRRRGAMFAEDGVELGPGETREHDVELAWGGAIGGRVVDGHGEPVSGVEVRIGQLASLCITDVTGAFECGGLAGGAYTATVVPGSGGHPFRFVDAPPKLELRDGGARIDGVRLVIQPTALAIEGTVIDGFGAPVSDVTVRAFGVDRRPFASFRMIPGALTDADGHFRIADLSPGDYHVEVESDDHATRRTITAGASNVALVVDRSPCDAARGHELPARFVRPPEQVVWNQQIALVGWSLPATAKVGAPFEMTLVYRALQPVGREWEIFAHYDSPTRRLNVDHDPAIGWCPTSQWQAGETIVDRVTVQFEEAGRYALTIGFFAGTAPDWENLRVSSAPAGMQNTKSQGVNVADVIVE
jgi:RNA polymerase sigma-70 factor (ECF subfamily)